LQQIFTYVVNQPGSDHSIYTSHGTGNKKLASWSFWQNTCRPTPRIKSGEEDGDILMAEKSFAYHSAIESRLLRDIINLEEI
jgi:hypothetical protein